MKFLNRLVKNRAYCQFVSWIGCFITLVDATIGIVSLGFYYPNIWFKFALLEIKFKQYIMEIENE